MEMGRHRLARRIAGAATAFCLVAAGCSGPSSPTASLSPHDSATSPAGDPSANPSRSSSAPAVTSSSSAPEVSAGELLVLGDAVGGGRALWSFDPAGHWTVIGPAPATTGLASFGSEVAVVGSSSVELRSVRAPGAAGAPMALTWSGTAPSKIASVSRSPNGTVALVSTDGDQQSYWLVAADGGIAALDPGPNQPFAPLAAWLDDARLLVLSTDKFQESRLAVVSVATKTIQLSSTLSGVRFFCVSPDRRYIAAATASRVYAGPVEAFLGTYSPPVVETLDPSTPTIVWALAFDDSGTRLAMLSATLTPDGRPTKVREVGYANASSSWTKAFDSPTPFGLAYDHVWLP